MKHSLLKFFVLLIIKEIICSVRVVTEWRLRYLNVSIFDDPAIPNAEIPTDSDLKCALLANRHKQFLPNVLFFNNGRCQMATVDLANYEMIFIQGALAVQGHLRREVPENIKKIGNKKYVLGPDRMIFGDAQQYCLSVGGTLAEPDLTQEAIEALSNGFHTEFADEIATITATIGIYYERWPWIGFIEEAADGALRHIRSGTVFPGSYSFISSRETSEFEGLALIFNPTTSFLDGPVATSDTRFPLCTLDDD